MKKRISIVLVDDHPPPRGAVPGLIQAQRGFEVLAFPADLDALTRTVRATRPDLVLLNLARKGRDRVRFAGQLHRAVPEPPLVLMGLAARREDLVGLVRAGVAGFIMADAPFDACVSTILLVASGIRVLPPDLTHALFIQLRGRTPPVFPPFRPLAAPGADSSVTQTHS